MTPAVKLAEKAKIPHEIQTYDHDPDAESFGLEAADVLGVDPNTVFKTLLAELDGSSPKRETVVAVVPVTRMLDLKALARAAGAKKAAMADPTDAERLTGYVVGGISPLGQRKRLRTFIDRSAADHDRINVSGGRRGLEIRLDPNDLARLTGAGFHPLATG